MNIKVLVASAVAAFSSLPVIAQQAPAPCGLVPSARQLEWYNREMIAFFHFGINTFEEYVNEGDGKASTAIFNPTALDCRQWMQTLKAAGIPAAILTAKHADGFCLWPSKYTDYSVKNAAWKNGKGDVVREFVDACEEYGLKAGIYLGPHDRHEHLSPLYTTERYKEYYAHQLGELMSDYGKIWETWWDGAGADELTTPVYRHWYKIVREKQPDCVIFGTKNSYPFADVRWMGNEAGEAGDPCWATTDSVAIRDEAQYYKGLNEGMLDGDAYIPAETDVSIRPSWFYHAEEDSRVKSVRELWDIYCTSVGRNSVLLLNFPPDRRGLIHPTDSLNAVSFHLRVQKELADNLLSSAKVSASDERGGQFKVRAVTDGKYDTYWATNDGVTTADLTFTFSQPTKMNRVMIQEYIPLGQRVKSFVVEYKKGDQWLSVKCNEETTTVGYKRLLRFEMIETEELRIRFTDARACLCINEVGAYYAPDATENYTPATSELKSFPFTILGVDMEEAKKCSDKDDQTTALISGKEIMIDLGENRTIHSFYYLPDQSEYSKGLISSYELSAGITEEAMQVVAQGEFSNIRNNPILQNMYFSPVEARYFKLKATRMVDESDSLGIAEIGCR